MPKAAKVAVVIVVALAGAFCIGSYALDRHMLAQTYARTNEQLPLMLTDEDVASDYPMSDVEFPLDGQTVRGHVYGAGNARGLVVFRHGIFSHHQDYLALITALVDRGWKVFAYDALGCGESDGDTVGGFAQAPLDVRAAVKFADESGMADGLPIMLFGHSWGAYGVAGALDFPDVRERVSACVAMSGFDTPTKIIVESAGKIAGPFAVTQTPVIDFIGWQDFGSDAGRSAVRAIDGSGLPVLVIHGSADAVVACDGASIVAQRDSISNPLVKYVIKDEPGRDGHNTYFYSPESTAYLAECRERLSEIEGSSDDPTRQNELDAFMASVDKRRANTADPVLMDEVDSFFASSL